MVPFSIILVGEFSIIIYTRFFETEATITGHDQQCIPHLVLHAEFEYKLIEIAMDVARHRDAFGGREFL